MPRGDPVSEFCCARIHGSKVALESGVRKTEVRCGLRSAVGTTNRWRARNADERWLAIQETG